jgi:hypothetical protein
MTTILTEVDGWVTATLLAVAMLLGWAFGWWRGRRLTKQEREAPASKFSDASLAVLGLLLAFTFSMAQSKHDQRRQMVVNDSNAIGDFYTCASLVKQPIRGKLQGVVREYVEHRLAIAQEHEDEPALQKKLAEIQTMHARMQTLVGEAVDGGTLIAIALVNTFNGVTSNHAAHLAATRDRLPASIVLLLCLFAVLSMVLVGTQQGATGEKHYGATVGFAALVCLVV